LGYSPLLLGRSCGRWYCRGYAIQGYAHGRRRTDTGGALSGLQAPPTVSTSARGGAVLPHHSPEGNGRTGGVHVALMSGFLSEEVGGRGAGRRSRGRATVPGHRGYPIAVTTVHATAERLGFVSPTSRCQRSAGAVAGGLIPPVLFKWVESNSGKFASGSRKGFRSRQ
jgi:hypothetical protein